MTAATIFGERRIYRAEGVEVKSSNLHGRGVFALKKFRKGDKIETAPIILLPAGQRAFLQPTLLFSYYFLINTGEKGVAVGLGYSSLYNHSYKANACFVISLRRRTITIKAYRTIPEGEEITFNYNGIPDDETPVYLALEKTQ
jgi:uncharacterized protein